MRRLAMILLVACLALPSVAGAQSNPFGPLPQPPPPAQPTPEPVEIDDGNLDTSVLLIIGGVVIAAFFGVGWYITRDARSRLTDDDRRSLMNERDGLDPERNRQSKAARKKARERAKAQKQARKKQRAR